MNQTLINVINYALLVLIKHRDKNGLLFYSQNLAKEFSGEDYVTVFNTFFQTNQQELTEEDVNFFNELALEMIAENKQKEQPKETPKVKKKKPRMKVDEEKRMKNIKKTIIFLEKKMGWQLGLDYSFLNGNIHMSHENKKKLREIMNK